MNLDVLFYLVFAVVSWVVAGLNAIGYNGQKNYYMAAIFTIIGIAQATNACHMYLW